MKPYAPEQITGFRRDLSLFDSTMIVVGSMIGSGIFIVSADITRTVGGGGLLLLVWLLSGLLTVIAARSYGELAWLIHHRPEPSTQFSHIQELQGGTICLEKAC